MTVNDEQSAHALMAQGIDDVAKNGILRLVMVVDAEGQVALTGVLRTHHDGWQHHAAHTIAVEGALGSIDGNGMREDAVGHVRQVEVMGLGGSPGKDGYVVLVLACHTVG